jgi:esterase/lipase superfamily enzyme
MIATTTSARVFLWALFAFASPLAAQIDYTQAGFKGSIECSIKASNVSSGSLSASVEVRSIETHSVTWTTDITGVKGDGQTAEFEVSRIPSGAHHLIFTVTDASGSATCSIPFHRLFPAMAAPSLPPRASRPAESAGAQPPVASRPRETYGESVPPPPPPPPPAAPPSSTASASTATSSPRGPTAAVSGDVPPTHTMSAPASTGTIAAVEAPKPTQPVNVSVHYMTDRKSKTRNNRLIFIGKRSVNAAVSYGVVTVSIPPSHRKGTVETPSFLASVVPTSMYDYDARYMSVKAVSAQSKEQFFHAFEVLLRDSDTALLFIHGYNVKFDDAAMRAAQMKYDLQFKGPVLLYSWASRGKLKGYTADEETAQWSARNLAPVLKDVAASTGAKRLVIIAHSMGNRVLTMALESLANQHVSLSATLKEVVLAAPDIDTGVFEQMAAAVRSSASHVTIYESTKDEALVASRKFHDGSRLGDAQPIHVVEGFDVMDASTLETDFLGHTYFANGSILADIADMLDGKTSPMSRNRWKQEESSSLIWFSPR